MPGNTNQSYLLNEQYKDAKNLHARAQLHERFSTRKENWFRWVFDHFSVPQDAHILELGTGSALLWKANLDRIPADWQITLSDFSPGMLREASKNLGDQSAFTFEIVDAQAIPFDAGLFDAVVANHMLYHVPDLPKALGEIRRVLKTDGRLYAATNGERHMGEIYDLVKEVIPADTWEESSRSFTLSSFRLENGPELLSQQFAHVELYRLANSLVVTEVEPLVAYIRSTKAGSALTEEQLTNLRTLLTQRIAEQGSIHITSDVGLFEAYGRN